MSESQFLAQCMKAHPICYQPMRQSPAVRLEDFEIKELDLRAVSEAEHKQILGLEKELSSLRFTFEALTEQIAQLRKTQ